MVELLSVIGVVVVAAAVLKRPTERSQKGEHQKENRAAPNAQTARTSLALSADAPKAVHAAPRDGRFAFVAGFGVRPEQLKELHIYAVAGSLEQFPRKVRELLRRLYGNGYAVGEEIMAVLHHGRPLKEGEAIYVAVARDERAETTRTVAFLDRRRAC